MEKRFSLNSRSTMFHSSSIRSEKKIFLFSNSQRYPEDANLHILTLNILNAKLLRLFNSFLPFWKQHLCTFNLMPNVRYSSFNHGGVVFHIESINLFSNLESFLNEQLLSRVNEIKQLQLYFFDRTDKKKIHNSKTCSTESFRVSPYAMEKTTFVT